MYEGLVVVSITCDDIYEGLVMIVSMIEGLL